MCLCGLNNNAYFYEMESEIGITKKTNKYSLKELLDPISIKQYWITNIILTLIIQALLSSDSFYNIRHFLIAFFWTFTICVTQSLGLIYLNVILNERSSWEKNPIKRLAMTVVLTIIYSPLAFLIVTIAFTYFFDSSNLANAIASAMPGVKITLYISFAFSFIFSSIAFFIDWQKAKLTAEKLQKELAKYRYETLKKQVNPHFLFNSLNVLADLVHEDAELSEQYIHQLSKIYRYVLESTNHQFVTLSEELEFIKSYIFLLKIRFENKLIINLDIIPQQDEYIIPVSIQTLIENAVKHNELTAKNPLTVHIKRNGNYISVENNLQKKASSQVSLGTGLDNLKQQFSFLSKRSVRQIISEDFFKVELPIIEQT